MTNEAFPTLRDAIRWYLDHMSMTERVLARDERREFIRNFLGTMKREAQPVNRDLDWASAKIIAGTPMPVTDAELDEAERTWGEQKVTTASPAHAALARWLHEAGGPRLSDILLARLTPGPSESAPDIMAIVSAKHEPRAQAALDWQAANDGPGNVRSLFEAMRKVGLEPSIESVPPRADGAMEERPGAGSPTLQSPSNDAMTAWRLKHVRGINKQSEIASIMSAELNRTINQGQVSRWLDEAKAYTEAGGIVQPLPTLTAQATSVDPAVIDMGPRADRRSRNQRDSADD